MTLQQRKLEFLQSHAQADRISMHEGTGLPLRAEYDLPDGRVVCHRFPLDCTDPEDLAELDLHRLAVELKRALTLRAINNFGGTD